MGAHDLDERLVERILAPQMYVRNGWIELSGNFEVSPGAFARLRLREARQVDFHGEQ